MAQCYGTVDKSYHKGPVHHSSLGDKVSHYLGQQGSHTQSCQTTCQSQTHHNMHSGHVSHGQATPGYGSGHVSHGYGDGLGHLTHGYSSGHVTHGHSTGHGYGHSGCHPSNGHNLGHVSHGHGTVCNGKSSKKQHKKNLMGKIKEKLGDSSSSSESESDSDDMHCSSKKATIVRKGMH